jgi:FKBP-type peptidyl-prolyl cis-trans isomerase 2
MTIATGDSVTLEYTGRLDDGTVFDTSRQSVAGRAGLAEAQPGREYAPVLRGEIAGTASTLLLPIQAGIRASLVGVLPP